MHERIDEIIEEKSHIRSNKEAEQPLKKVTGLSMDELIADIRDKIQRTLRAKANQKNSHKNY